MTTDIAVLERALITMAVFMGIQTALLVGVAIAAYRAWRTTVRAFEDAKASLNTEIGQVRTQVDRIVATVDDTATAVRRGSEAVGDAVSDVRQVVHTVRDSLGSVASVVTAPKAAMALGLWRGVQMFRNRRSTRDPDTIVASPKR